MYESSQAWNDLMVMSMNLITHLDYYWLINNILYNYFYVQTMIIALKNTYTFYYSQLSFMKCVVSTTIDSTTADSFLSRMHKSMDQSDHKHWYIIV